MSEILRSGDETDHYVFVCFLLSGVVFLSTYLRHSFAMSALLFSTTETYHKVDFNVLSESKIEVLIKKEETFQRSHISKKYNNLPI